MRFNDPKTQRWVQRRVQRHQPRGVPYQNPAHGRGPMGPHYPQGPDWNFDIAPTGAVGPSDPKDLPWYKMHGNPNGPEPTGPMGPFNPLQQIPMYEHPRRIFGLGFPDMERLYGLQEALQSHNLPIWMGR